MDEAGRCYVAPPIIFAQFTHPGPTPGGQDQPQLTGRNAPEQGVYTARATVHFPRLTASRRVGRRPL
jgi:hypothetical protein